MSTMSEPLPTSSVCEAMAIQFRSDSPDDLPRIRQVHARAFGQQSEADLVDALRAGGHARISLVAETESGVVGHILFSEMAVLTHAGDLPALSLAPVAVLPEHQRQGIGAALIRQGLAAAREAGHDIVIVLGHPDYYPRFGFSASLAERLGSPFAAGPAWMAMELSPGALAKVDGWAAYPPPFQIEPHVRPVFPRDRSEWLRMRTALLPEAAADHPGAIEALLRAAAAGAGSSAVFVVARPQGLGAFIELSIRPFAEGCVTDRVAYVEAWYVDQDLRRRGPGRALLAAGQGWAPSRDCTELAWDARLDNRDSHAVHLALGFAEVERLVCYRMPLAEESGHSA